MERRDAAPAAGFRCCGPGKLLARAASKVTPIPEDGTHRPQHQRLLPPRPPAIPAPPAAAPALAAIALRLVTDTTLRRASRKPLGHRGSTHTQPLSATWIEDCRAGASKVSCRMW